jgi:hypothetical protein
VNVEIQGRFTVRRRASAATISNVAVSDYVCKYVAAHQEPQVKKRIDSAGCVPVPDDIVAVPPALSVIVNVTCSGRATPSLVLPVLPHVSLNENCGFAPVCVKLTAAS